MNEPTQPNGSAQPPEGAPDEATALRGGGDLGDLALAPARGGAEIARPPSPRSRILVVDDERFFREAIRETLEEGGFSVATAASGSEALELLADPEIAVMVLDIQMPGMNGIEVLRRVRETHPSLRVLILSAHTDQEIVLEALRLGAADYLAKPLHDEELVLAVRRALETYAFAAAWDGLRARLGFLETKLGELVREAESDEPTPAAIAARAADAAAGLLGATRTSLLLVDADGSRLRVAGVCGHKLAPEEIAPVPVGEGVAGRVFTRGQGVVVQDAAGDPRWGAAEAGRYASASFAVAPVASGERVLGVLCATERSGGAVFDDTDLALLRILAAQVGMLLGAVAFREAHPASAPAVVAAADLDATLPETLAPVGPAPEELERDAELARRVCDAVSAEVEPARVLDAALRPIADALDAAPVSLYLRDPDLGDLACEGQVDGGRAADRARLPAARGLTGSVLGTGVLVAAPSPEEDPRFDADVDTPEGGAVAPLLCLPVRFRGKTLGVLRAFLPPGATPSARTGEVLTAAISAAVRNVFLYRSLVDSIEEVARARREAAGAS